MMKSNQIMKVNSFPLNDAGRIYGKYESAKRYL